MVCAKASSVTAPHDAERSKSSTPLTVQDMDFSSVETDVALLEIIRDALKVSLLLREFAAMPILPGEEAISRAFRRGRLRQLRRLIEQSIDLVDRLEGDFDLEDADPTEQDDADEDEELSWQEID